MRVGTRYISHDYWRWPMFATVAWYLAANYCITVRVYDKEKHILVAIAPRLLVLASLSIEIES